MVTIAATFHHEDSPLSAETRAIAMSRSPQIEQTIIAS